MNHLARYSPYFLGATTLFNEIESLAHRGISYPPYTLIEFPDSNTYRIEFALAGFNKDQIKVVQENGYLIIEGEKLERMEGVEETFTYLHKGISEREFRNKFKLTENVEVVSADFTNGILSVILEKIVPESEKPRTIKIKS